MYDNIPKEIATLKQWTHSLSTKEPKRPAYTKYVPNGSLSLNEAWDKVDEGMYVGFYTTKEDQFVIGDIDHIEDPNDLSSKLVTEDGTRHSVPIEIGSLLTEYGAYCEISPSGKGIRFVLRLTDSKEDFYKDIYYHKKLGRLIQLNVGPPWLTFTGKPTIYSADTIGEVDTASLSQAYNFREREETVCDVTPENPPNFDEVMMALHGIALDQNPRIQRAFETIFKEAYTHYVFWLKVIMAVHNYASFTGMSAACLEQVIEWSKTDPHSYDGEEPVIDKWNSLSRDRDIVSYKTLFGLYYANILRWPKVRPYKKKDKNKVAKPVNSEFVNFLELLKHYDINVYRDIHSPFKFYLTGDEDICDKYFTALGIQKYLEKYYGVFSEKFLISAFHILCQDVGFEGISHIQIKQFIRNTIFQIRNELDIVKEYFNTPFKELPESYKENARFYSISTIEYMFSCLKIDYQTTDHDRERDLYETYYRSWLMGLVRSLFYRDSYHMNNCVLLLTGPEQIRKTSHFKFMLPSFMRDEYVAFTTHGFNKETSMRDVVKLSSENLLIVWDELEQHLDRQSESNFKKIIDNNPQKFIDKYEVVPSNIIPMAMYGATSNKREFNLSDTGSRRLYHIPVSWVDTDKLNKVCWHKVINDLREEIKEAPCDNPPWLLTKNQLTYQALLHNRITNKTGMEFVLNEIFDWDTVSCIRLRKLPKGQTNPKTSIHCISFKKLRALVSAEIGHVPTQKEQLALKKSITKLCSIYTKTQRDSVMLSVPMALVKQGQMNIHGCNYFVVPKRRKRE